MTKPHFPTVTIEQIAGKPCTVIKTPFDAEYVRRQLEMGVPVVAEHVTYGRDALTHMSGHKEAWFCGSGFSDRAERFIDTVVILPALPRYPKPEDAALLYRYMAEGILLTVELDDHRSLFGDAHILLAPMRTEITHALHGGERVDIAIEGE